VRRYCQTLERLGHNLRYSLIDGHSAVRLVQKTYLDVPITRRQSFTLRAVRRVFDPITGTSLHEDVERVLEKLTERLPAKERDEYQLFGDRFVYVPDGGVKSYVDKDDIIDALQTGVMDRKVVRYAYRQARGRAQSGYIAPYALAMYRNGLYAIARRLNRPEDGATPAPADTPPTALPVERFTLAEWIPRTTFEVPEGFKVSDYFDGAFGICSGASRERVVLEFTKEKSTYVLARRYHPTQKTETLPDGRVRLEFECTNLTEVVSWVLSWGPHARVIAPPVLAQQVAGELQQATSLYAA
jgi:proteasome accessory factor B